MACNCVFCIDLLKMFPPILNSFWKVELLKKHALCCLPFENYAESYFKTGWSCPHKKKIFAWIIVLQYNVGLFDLFMENFVRYARYTQKAIVIFIYSLNSWIWLWYFFSFLTVFTPFVELFSLISIQGPPLSV